MSDTSKNELPKKSSNAVIASVIITALVAGGVAFYGGMVYGKNQASTAGNGQRVRFAGNFPGGGNFVRRNGGGFTEGNILAKDATTVTLQLTSGGSKIVFYSDKTTVQKTTAGSISDLQVGETVRVMGTANADGSLTAELFQLGAIMPTRPQNQPPAPPPGS